MTLAYELRAQTPTPEDFARLRAVCGMSPRSPEGIAIGLPRSWFAVTVHIDGEVLGMGRVIGDGGTAFQITDICVDPKVQGQGIGKAIMAALMAQIDTHAPPNAYVSLIADGDAQHLYAKYGFAPVMPESIGMYYRVARI